MVVYVLLTIFVVVGAFIVWMKWRMAKVAALRDRDLRRFGLEELDARLTQEMIDDRRPIGTDPRMFIVDTIVQLLRELESMPPGAEQAAVVEPSNEVVRLACEELVRRNLMASNRDGTLFVFRRSMRPGGYRPNERPS